MIYQDRLADEAKAAFVATHLDKASAQARNGGAHLAYMAHFLAKSGSGYLVGGGLTMADIVMFDIMDLLNRIFPDSLKVQVRGVAVVRG